MELVLLVVLEQPVQQDQVVRVQLILLLAHQLHMLAVVVEVLGLPFLLELAELAAVELVEPVQELVCQALPILAAGVVELAIQQLQVKDQAAQV